MLRDRSKTADVDVMASVFSSISLLLTISTPTERRNAIQMLVYFYLTSHFYYIVVIDTLGKK